MTKSELIKNVLLIASHTQNNPEYEELLKEFDDFVLVPREPTERMLDASRRRQWDELSLPMEDMDYLKYKAMIKEGEIK